MKKILAKLKECLKIVIKKVQDILLIIGLFIVYTLGFGITLFLITIFNRRLLKTGKAYKDSFWEDAKDYDPDINKCLKQF